MSRAASNVTRSGESSPTPLTRYTWLTISTSNILSSWRAMAPAATRAAVSRALARSSTSRMSVRSYLMAPARSACPGRGRVTTGRSVPEAPAGASSSACIVCCQFSQSLLRISSEIGEPSVSPARTPDRISALSDSIAMRRPRPYPPWRRLSCSVMASKSICSPAGMPSSIATSPLPWDSPAVRKRSIASSFYTKFLRSPAADGRDLAHFRGRADCNGACAYDDNPDR